MTNHNYKSLVNQKPIETVQKIENLTWEQTIENEESKCLISTLTLPSSSRSFYIRIESENYFFTKANAISTFLGTREKEWGITFNKVEEVQKFLQELKEEKIRFVNFSFGIETKRAIKEKNIIKKTFKSLLTRYNNGEEIFEFFTDAKR